MNVAVAGRRRLTHSAAGLLVVCAVFASCGVPTDPDVRVVQAQDLPNDLGAPSTSTTTTTTTTTIAVSETTTTTTPAPSTTAQQLVAVPLYFVSGERLLRVVRMVPTEPDLNEVLTLLTYGPLFDEYPDRTPRTSLGLGDVLSASKKDGIATIDMSEEFRALPRTDRRRAIAQIVMTVASRPGIGPVRFQINGAPLSVLRGDGSIGGSTVSSDDYRDIVDDPSIASTTTTVVSSDGSTSTDSLPEGAG